MKPISRKTAPLEDFERKELRRIVKTYGLAKEFIERSGLSRPTLKSLAKNGYGLEDTIAKARIALTPHSATKEAVLEAVCRVLEVGPEKLLESGDPRAIAAYLLSNETGMSLSAIARELKYNDHTSVIVALRGNKATAIGLENRIDVDKELRQRVERCRRAIIRKPSND